jgi:hypothetical protein
MEKKKKIIKELENFFVKKEGKEILKSIKKKKI